MSALLLCHRDGSIVKGGWRPNDPHYRSRRVKVRWTRELDLYDDEAWFDRICVDPDGVVLYWEEVA